MYVYYMYSTRMYIQNGYYYADALIYRFIGWGMKSPGVSEDERRGFLCPLSILISSPIVVTRRFLALADGGRRMGGSVGAGSAMTINWSGDRLKKVGGVSTYMMGININLAPIQRPTYLG